MINKILLLFGIFSLIFFNTNAQFVPDSTFNEIGVTDYMQWTGGYKNGDRIAHTSDGGIIVAGRYDNRAAIWKYKQDGTLDESFGESGAFYHTLGTSYIPWAREVAVLSDGSIVVLWQCELFYSSSLAYTTSSILLAKLNADGTIDADFGIDGVVNTRPKPAYEYDPARLYIDSLNERIYVCGMSPEQGHYDCVIGTGAWFIAKFNLNTGALDPTFSDDGCLVSTSQNIRMAETITPLATIYDVKVTPSNKLFVTGMLHRLDSTIFTMQLNMDGSYDESFGVSGRKLIPVSDLDMYTSVRANYMRILNDNSVIIARYEMVYSTTILYRDTAKVRMLKINTAGNRDWTFGTVDGLACYNEVGSYPMITLDQSNNFLLSWYEVLGTNEQRVGFKKLLPNGTTNTSFGTAGMFYSSPIHPDTFMNPSDMRQVIYNETFDEITMIGLRSKPTNPTTYRLLNFKVQNKTNTGIHSMVNPIYVSLYPNPTNDFINIQSTYSENIVAVQVTDVIGRTMFIQSFESNQNKYSINVKEWNSGNYFVKITFKDGTHFTQQIVKK